MIFGQVISILGNSIVSFSLTLYILDITGSAAIFGVVTAVSILPWAIAGPIGGVLADKYSKKNIMVILDFLTFALIFAVAIIGLNSNAIIIIGTMRIILSIIQALYIPSVNSSLVYLVEPSYLVKANSLTSSVNSFARILGPVLAGIIYSIMPINYVLYISGSLFFICAIIECFMKIPKISRNNINEKQQESYTIKQSILFIIKNNRHLFMFFCFVALIGLCITPLITIGLAYIVNIYLNLPSEFYGISSAVVSIGTLGAGFMVFIFPNKFMFNKCGLMYIASGVFTIFIGISLYFTKNYVSFALLCLFVFLLMGAISIIHILTHSFVQRITPPEMLGKVMSCVIIMLGFFEPLGQVLFGFIFDIPNLSPVIIIIISGIIVILLSVFAAKTCKKAQENALKISKH